MREDTKSQALWLLLSRPSPQGLGFPAVAWANAADYCSLSTNRAPHIVQVEFRCAAQVCIFSVGLSLQEGRLPWSTSRCKPIPLSPRLFVSHLFRVCVVLGMRDALGSSRLIGNSRSLPLLPSRRLALQDLPQRACPTQACRTRAAPLACGASDAVK